MHSRPASAGPSHLRDIEHCAPEHCASAPSPLVGEGWGGGWPRVAPDDRGQVGDLVRRPGIKVE